MSIISLLNKQREKQLANIKSLATKFAFEVMTDKLKIIDMIVSETLLATDYQVKEVNLAKAYENMNYGYLSSTVFMNNKCVAIKIIISQEDLSYICFYDKKIRAFEVRKMSLRDKPLSVRSF